MSNLPHTAKATAEEKIKWILDHWNMCESYPDKHAGKLPKHKNIVRAMQRDGLFSKTSYEPDVMLINYIKIVREIKENEK